MTCFNDTVKQLVKVKRVFANASGGKVLVGVADDGKITGTATDNVSCSRIQDVINQIEPQIDAHISNPGGLPSGLTAQTFGTKSVVRNPIIAALLHRSGYIEKIGITPNGIKYHLDKLRRQGVIRHVGATKKGSWELVEDDD